MRQSINLKKRSKNFYLIILSAIISRVKKCLGNAAYAHTRVFNRSQSFRFCWVNFEKLKGQKTGQKSFLKAVENRVRLKKTRQKIDFFIGTIFLKDSKDLYKKN